MDLLCWQAINSPEACKRRLLKYVVPVVLISTFINIPKFFESEVKRGQQYYLANGFFFEDELFCNETMVQENLKYLCQETYVDQSKMTEEDWVKISNGGSSYNELFPHKIFVTELRQSKEYVIYYTNWTRLILISIIPTVLLIYFNYKVIVPCMPYNSWLIVYSVSLGTRGNKKCSWLFSARSRLIFKWSDMNFCLKLSLF